MMNVARFYLLFFVVTLSGCFIWSGVEDPKLGGPDGSTGEPTKVVPDRPPEETSSPDDDGVMHFAAYDVKMIQPGTSWRDYGLNLDGVDTQNPWDPHACSPRKEGDNPALDGNGGIDNQYGAKVSPLLSFALPTAVCEMTGSHYRGKGTFVAGIENWNGEKDDARVTAWIIPAVGAMSTPDGTEPESGVSWGGDRGLDLHYNGEPAPLPCFDGNDYFYINSDLSVMGPFDPTMEDEPRRPRIFDPNAYVVDNVIVARVPGTHPFTLMSVNRSLPALINEGYIVAKLSDDYSRIEESTLAGRFRAQSILDVTRQIGSCEMGLITTLASALNDAADLMAESAKDHTGEMCDAISIGIPFKAVRTHIASTLGPAWPPDDHCALVEELAPQLPPKLYGCQTSASTYEFAHQWDQVKNPGLMDHCQSGTLIPGVLD